MKGYNRESCGDLDQNTLIYIFPNVEKWFGFQTTHFLNSLLEEIKFKNMIPLYCSIPLFLCGGTSMTVALNRGDFAP